MSRPNYIQIGGLKCVEAHLSDGPYDGVVSAASHRTVVFEKEHYCHVPNIGDALDVYRHSLTWLEKNTPRGKFGVMFDRRIAKMVLELVYDFKNPHHAEAMNLFRMANDPKVEDDSLRRLFVHTEMIRSGM